MDSFAYFEHVLPVFSIKVRSSGDYVNLRKQFVIFGEGFPAGNRPAPNPEPGGNAMEYNQKIATTAPL